jgi:dolichyl-diphosphooligosaccharide--protein glycosyltransferase
MARRRNRAPAAARSVGPRLAIAVLILLSAAAVVARVVPIWSQVFPASGHVRLLGSDPYYHLRHARFVAHQFPHLQRWDIGTHYPEGQWSDATGLFDLAMGTAAWLIGLGSPTNDLVDHVAAWTPPLLAALSIWLVFLLARTVLDRRAALLAAAVFLLYPGSSLHRSLLGFADHHIAEVVLGLLTAWGLTRCLQAGESASPAVPWWRPAFVHALPLAIFLFTWVGAPIYLLFVFVVLLVVATVEISHGARSTATQRGGLRYGSALLLMVGVPSLLWPDLVMVPDRSHLVLLGCVAVAVVPAAYVFVARLVLRRLERPRLVALLAAAALLAAVAIGAFATTVAEYVPAAGMLANILLETKGAFVGEHRIVDWYVFGVLLGVSGLAALAALPLGLWRALHRPDDRFCLVPILFGGLLLGLWLNSRDYDYAAPAFVAVMAAFVTVEAAGRISARHIARLRWPGSLALAAALLLPIWPLQVVLRPAATVQMAANHMVVTPAWEQATSWLRQHTPRPSLPVDARVEPFADSAGFRYPPGAYGVFSAWDFGNLVNALGERVPVWSRWPSARTAKWMVCEDEKRSLKLLCPSCEEGEEVRYVVLDARTISQHFPSKLLLAGRRPEDYNTVNWYSAGNNRVPHRTFGPRYERSMAVRLYRDDARDVGRYRLVYESYHESYLPYLLLSGTNNPVRVAYGIGSESQRKSIAGRVGIGRMIRAGNQHEYDGLVTPSVKIFEVVPGARLTGRAPAETVVEAHLALRCGARAREVNYVRSAVAGGDGRFKLVVAHPTEPATVDAICGAVGPYEIFIRSTPEAEAVKVGTVAVSTRQVRDGTRVRLDKEWREPFRRR